MFLWILLTVGTLPLLWLLWTYNRFVARRNAVREAWSGIDVQLKRRRDLVPNLIEVVKAYCAHERSLFESLAAERAAAAGARLLADTREAENGLSRDLRRLIAVAEAYPDLKADENFRRLGDALIEVEDNLQDARRYYNGAVRDWNILVESFPSLLVARLGRFPAAEFFEIESAVERGTPEVKL
jgi:LemA protein